MSSSGLVQPDPYQRIIEISKLFKQSLSSAGFTNPKSTHTATPSRFPPALQLNIPPHVQQELEDEYVPVELRTALSSTIEDLRSEYQRLFQQTQQKTLATPIPQLDALGKLSTLLEQRFYSKAVPALYEKHVQAKEDIAVSIAAASTIPSTSTAQFNHAFIPILTSYFNWNPFPPAQDRKMLADKGAMTERQIEVWFQNRRALSRKRTGLALRKQDFKRCLNRPPPDDVLKSLNATVSSKPSLIAAAPNGSGVVFVPPEQRRSTLEKKKKQDEEAVKHWGEGWGSIGGLCGFGLGALRLGRGAGKPSAKKYEFRKGLGLGRVPKEKALTRSEWEAARKEGKVTFAVEGFVVTPRKERAEKEMDVKAEMRRLVSAFAPSGVVWGDLGTRMDGEHASPIPKVGAATAGVTSDIRWFVDSKKPREVIEIVDSDDSDEEEDEEDEIVEVDRREWEKRQEARQNETERIKRRKERLGAKRIPTRWAPYPVHDDVAVGDLEPNLPGFSFNKRVDDLMTGKEMRVRRDRRSKARSTASPEPSSRLASSSSSSSLSSVPSLTHSSPSSDDEDDFESLFSDALPIQAQTPPTAPAAQPLALPTTTTPASSLDTDFFATIFPEYAPTSSIPVPPVQQKDTDMFDFSNIDFSTGMAVGYDAFANPTADLDFGVDWSMGMGSGMDGFVSVPVPGVGGYDYASGGGW
uniref:Putative homeodomain 2 protein n=1 Tax=Flammulina velutipes TaxID=38945 RepID=M4MKQ8_FLAVE|nr:putative homeodomain 2 protein [Flammulina velutipes]